jgi:sulfur-oxidizing protein SoxX
LNTSAIRGALRVDIVVLAAVLAVASIRPTHAGENVPLAEYEVDRDSIPQPLGGLPGDPVRGAALFAARQVSTCLLCHADPSAVHSAGSAIGPSLVGVGSRLTAGQIRLRIVDAARVNPETIMPSFHVVQGLTRVGHAWQGRPVLDAGQIEDLVAYLVTLRAP